MLCLNGSSAVRYQGFVWHPPEVFGVINLGQGCSQVQQERRAAGAGPSFWAAVRV